MLTCTFFGHRDTPREIRPILRSTLIDLIENKNVLNFYVGNHGNFDAMVSGTLRELKEIYLIRYAVVFAYLPSNTACPEEENFDNPIFPNTVFPDGIETVPPRFRIDYRNRWMLKQSDYVITYVRYTTGGAVKYKEIAERSRKKKIVINLADEIPPRDRVVYLR